MCVGIHRAMSFFRRCLTMVALSALAGCATGNGDVVGAGADVPVSGDAPVRDDAQAMPDITVKDDVPTGDDAMVGDDKPAPKDIVVVDDSAPDVIDPPDIPTTPDVPPPDVGPMCNSDQRLCGGTCVSVQIDALNCGACGNACTTGTTCMSGVCRSTCAAGQTACPDAGGVTCVNTQSDGANCGGCGRACTGGQTCSAGRCVSTCPAGQVTCPGGTCADTQADSSNCGACGTVCGTGQTCVAGRCTCPTGQSSCSSRCVDLQTDNTNCGRCATVCGRGQSCAAGACVCPAGQSLCAGACIDTRSDTANCGRCSNACVSGQTCTAGACVCPAGQSLCGGRCVNTQTDGANCGACGNACPTGQTCTSGTCTCPTGQTACSGRCVNLQTDNANCGTCGRACPAGNSCAAGACTCACPTGQSCCGSSCINLQTSNTNCGTCGRACATGTTCRAGMCAPANDDRASATALTLTAAETTVMGSTVGASFDGPTTCTTSAPNVWYRVTLATREVLYADTAGSAYDTRLYLVDSAGTVVANTCNDDAGCSAGGFTSTLQSRFAAVVAAGTYYIAVSGFTTSSTGAFTLHVQHIPANYGSFFYATAITGTSNVGSVLVSGGVRTPTCTLGPSGEDMRWFVTCGSTTVSLFSLCAADGGTYLRQSGTTYYDPVLYVYSGGTATQVQCNDDGPSGTNCQGTGGSTSNYGSRISAAMPRGVNAVLVDERLHPNGMTYTMHYEIQ